MTRRNVSSGSAFEAQIGYSRAVVLDDFIFVSGTTGYNYQTGAISPDIAEQTEQTMQNITAALAEAGAQIKDVVRVRYILPDRRDFQKTWAVLQKYFGDVRPAATMIQAGLMEEVMKIEIEVTAKKANADR
ncbi:endoribonuclease L-PSP [Colletotrichum eremochloae]|nr:endoribonuclease L-PSP [Colletotrichum eremochloae]